MSATDVTLDDLARQMAAAGLIPVEAMKTVETPDEVEIDEQPIEDLLEEALEGIELSEPKAIEAAPEPVNVEEIAADLDMEEARAEIYAEQDAGAELSLSDAVEAQPIDEADKEEAYASQEAGDLGTDKPKAKRAKGTGTGTRTARFVNGAGAFVAGVAGDAELQAIVDGLPKKVKDKAANLVLHLKGAGKLSVYTETALNLIRQNGSLTASDLRDTYMAQTKRNGGEGYSKGTAASQAQQQITLLSRLNICLIEGGKLVPNASSPYAVQLGIAS